VLQPFGKRTDKQLHNDKVYQAFKPLEVIRPSLSIDAFRGDTKLCSKAERHANAIECVKKRDFCVVDVTGQNPNVLYQAAGFAFGLHRELVDFPSETIRSFESEFGR
jgi:hypothetical protein